MDGQPRAELGAGSSSAEFSSVRRRPAVIGRRGAHVAAPVKMCTAPRVRLDIRGGRKQERGPERSQRALAG